MAVHTFHNAFWFTSKEKIEIGDYVHVWSKSPQILTYPGQATATKIVIEKETKDDKNLTTKEVLKRAVKEIENITGEKYYAPILTKIDYEEKIDTWFVSFKNNDTETDLITKIKDYE